MPYAQISNTFVFHPCSCIQNLLDVHLQRSNYMYVPYNRWGGPMEFLKMVGQKMLNLPKVSVVDWHNCILKILLNNTTIITNEILLNKFLGGYIHIVLDIHLNPRGTLR